MSSDSSKVTGGHLRRDAYLYVRQSTMYQVIHNTESTRGQYDLKGRAVALGWQLSQVHVIDVTRGLRRVSRGPRRVPATGRRGVAGPGRDRARPGMLQVCPRQRRWQTIKDLRPPMAR